MDQYVEAVAVYPDATFSFVGHSNGTHLLAKALTVYKACRFDNIVFAGSVVRHDFDWVSLQKSQQVARVLNYVATRDLVVAIFPGAFEKFGSELGSAGHNGFRQFKKGKSKSPAFMRCGESWAVTVPFWWKKTGMTSRNSLFTAIPLRPRAVLGFRASGVGSRSPQAGLLPY